MSTQAGKPMDHEYDGIQEYDNPLPGWWTLLFYATIVFSFAYVFVAMVRPQWTDPNLQYDAAVTRELERQFAEIGELEPDRATILSFMEDEDKAKWLQFGEAIFQTNCVSCHGRKGEGISGPNMTDDHYINVKKLVDVATTVQKGSVSAGMPAWENRLVKNEIVLVSAYVASLRGGNVSGRDPEGDIIPGWKDGE